MLICFFAELTQPLVESAQQGGSDEIIPVKLNSVKPLKLNHHTSRQLKFYKLSFLTGKRQEKRKWPK